MCVGWLRFVALFIVGFVFADCGFSGCLLSVFFWYGYF